MYVNVNEPILCFESSSTFKDDTRTGSSNIRTFSELNVGQHKRTGFVNPSWRVKIVKKQDATSDYFVQNTVYDGPARNSLAALQRGSGFEVYSSGQLSHFGKIVLGSQATDVATRNLALSRIKNQLRKTIGYSRTLPPLAEGKELGHLVSQALHLTLNLVHTVALAKKTRGRSLKKFMSDSWLGYNFGMKPLISDIADVGNAVTKYLARTDISQRLVGSAVTHGSFSYSPSFSNTTVPYGYSLLTAQGEAHYSLGYKFIGTFNLPLRSSNDNSIFHQLGIEFDQIPATLWELTGYSWMVDYFTNVGDFLADAFYSPPGNTRYLVENRRFECNFSHTFTAKEDFTTGQFSLSNTRSPSNGTYFEFQRTGLASLPHAQLYFKDPLGIGSHFGPKLANLLAVLNKRGPRPLAPFSGHH